MPKLLLIAAGAALLAIATVTSAAWSPKLSRPIALGYVHRDFVEPGTRVTVEGASASVSESARGF